MPHPECSPDVLYRDEVEGWRKGTIETLQRTLHNTNAFEM